MIQNRSIIIFAIVCAASCRAQELDDDAGIDDAGIDARGDGHLGESDATEDDANHDGGTVDDANHDGGTEDDANHDGGTEDDADQGDGPENDTDIIDAGCEPEGSTRCDAHGDVEVCTGGSWVWDVDCGLDGCCGGRCCEPSCVPDCDGKECGPDGCGGDCGPCGVDEVCSMLETCVSTEDAIDCRGYWECYDPCLNLTDDDELLACVEACDEVVTTEEYALFTDTVDCIVDFDCTSSTIGQLMSCSATHCLESLRNCFPQDVARTSCSRAFTCLENCEIAFPCFFECVVGTTDDDLATMSAYLDCLHAVGYCEGLAGEEYETCVSTCETERSMCITEPTDDEMYSCDGHCSSRAPGGCSCEASCFSTGDCCEDYAAICLGDTDGLLSCEGRCGSTAPGGCSCSLECLDDGSCCPDFLTECGAADDLFSCEGRCGERAPGGCFCTPDCVAEGDCCLDFLDHCVDEFTDAFSCVGSCGGMAPGGCGCDSDCLTSGDCCFDYLDVCTSSSRDCDAEFDECVDDCLLWALFGGYEICVEDCAEEYIWCEAMT